MSKQENNKDFETSLKKLEKIVSDLENGDLPLEESIKTFEEGVKLTKHCQNLLSKAELKIQKLVESKDAVSYTHLTLPTIFSV